MYYFDLAPAVKGTYLEKAKEALKSVGADNKKKFDQKVSDEIAKKLVKEYGSQIFNIVHKIQSI